MKIINIDSPILLTEEQVAFTEKVIRCGEPEGLQYDSISILMDEIPVFLVSKETMDEIENDKENEPIDALGFYMREFPVICNNAIRAIGLCPEKIVDHEKGNIENQMYLVAKILVHEFAHAKMDLHPNADYTGDEEFYKWMEEPMANLITLQYFKRFEENTCYKYKSFSNFQEPKYEGVFKFVENFISKQPDNYKPGINLFEHESLKNSWDEWRKHKKHLSANKTSEKKAWVAKWEESKEEDIKKLLIDLGMEV